MRPVWWKFALTGLVGVGMGLFGGQITVADMTPPAAASRIGGRAEPGYGAVSYTTHGPQPDYATIAADCGGCSDDDLGYRFAAARHVRDSVGCMDFNWPYQRGCLAWLREG